MSLFRRLHHTNAVCALLIFIVGCNQMNGLRFKDSSLAQTARAESKAISTKNAAPKEFQSSTLSTRESADACLAAAEDLEQDGWYQEAIQGYERVLGFDPNRPGISHRLARLYARQGQVELAVNKFADALKAAPGDAQCMSDYGYFMYEQGNLPVAEQYLRQALQLSPTDNRIRTNLAIVLAANQRTTESLQLLEQAVGKAAAHFNLSVLLARNGQFTASQAMLERARQLNPQMPEAKAFQEWLTEQQAVQTAGVHGP